MTRALLVVAAALAAAAPAAAEIVPGKGIGPVRLGMTEQQVRARLGKPLGVERDQVAFGAQRVMLYFGYGAYDVELRGRGAVLRVVAVTTGLRAQRTSAGIGTFSTGAELLKRHPTARCDAPDLIRNRDGVPRGYGRRECALTVGDTQTVFLLTDQRIRTDPPRWLPRESTVIQVTVRAV